MEVRCLIFGCILGVFGTLVGILVRRAIDARKKKSRELKALVWRKYHDACNHTDKVAEGLRAEIKKMNPHGVDIELH